MMKFATVNEECETICGMYRHCDPDLEAPVPGSDRVHCRVLDFDFDSDADPSLEAALYHTWVYPLYLGRRFHHRPTVFAPPLP